MSLTWTLDFRVNDNPLRATSRELVQFNERLGKTRDLLWQVETASGKATLNLTKISDAAGIALGGALVQGAKLAAAAIAGLALALDSFGDKAIEAFNERQGSLRAYTTLLGDAKKAEEEFFKAQALSQKTDLTAGQVEGAQKSLMVAGFRGGDLDKALLAVADLTTMAAPKDREMMAERSARALAQINSKGKLQGEEIGQLTEAGFSRKMLSEVLISAGVGKDAAAVEKAISAGKVSSEVGIAAIEQALLKQFGTQRLGEYATGSAGSTSSLLSNRDEAMANLLKGFDPEKLPEARAYRESLAREADALSTQSETGQNLSLTLQDLSNEAMGLKSSWEEFRTGFIEEFSTAWVGMLKEMDLKDTGTKWAGAREAAHELGGMLGKLAAGIGYVVHAIEQAGSLLNVAGKDLAWAVKNPMNWLFGDERGQKFDTGRGQFVMTGDEGGGGPIASQPSADADVYVERDGKTVQVQAALDRLPGRARGGLVSAGQPYVVGEEGPELFVPGSSGAIAPNGAGVSVGAVNITVSGAGSPQEVADAVYDRFVRHVGRFARNPGAGL